MTGSGSGWVAAVVGLALGIVMGVLTLVASPWSALGVMVMGLGGALFGWVAYGLATGGLDFGAAWRALRKK